MAKNKVIRLIGINIIIFILGYIIVDLILGHYKIPYDFNSFRMKHPYYHHGLMPNISQYTSWGKHIYKIHTNSLGFRDSAVREIELSGDGKRILIVGDSHSEGVGVEYNKTFPGILQQKSEETNTEILNAAAVSYSPKIYYLKTEYLLNYHGLEIDEVWIFIDISDLQNEIAYESFYPELPGAFFTFKERFLDLLERYSFTYYSIHSRIERKRLNAFINRMQLFHPQQIDNLQKHTAEIYEDFFRNFDDDDLLRSPEFHGVGEWYYNEETRELADKGLDLGQHYMEKLDSLCDVKNIRMKLSVHPWHAQIYKKETSDYYVSEWKNFCMQHDIEFINLFPLFVNVGNPFSTIEKYYIPGDNHWNEEGHKKVGLYLYRCLMQNQ
jgi:hypothetical protein